MSSQKATNGRAVFHQADAGEQQSYDVHLVGFASDSERERVAASLREHFLRGRLTLDEFSARVGLALRARTQDELRRALSGLPSPYALTRVVARAAAVVLLTCMWVVFSFLLLGLLALVLLVHGTSTVELAGFLVVWLIPTYLLFRQWRRALTAGRARRY